MDARFGGTGGGIAWPRLTPAVRVLLIVNVGVFLLNALTKGLFGLNLGEWFGLTWSGLGDGFGLGVLRLLAYQVVHSFNDPLPLLFNMLMLYFFGTFVEGAIGTRRMVWLYVIAGVVGGVVQLLLGRVMGAPDVVTIGASGALYGIMVYAACLAPRMTVIMLVFPIELRWLVGIMVGLGVYLAYVGLVTGHTGGVAHGGHLGGALWGYLAYKLPAGSMSWDPLAKVRRWSADRERKSAHHKQQVLDELLEKVHREGLGALTPAERRFLDKASQEMRRK